MKIGEAIKHLRKEAGLKQNELAEKIGYTQSHLSQIETGHKKPSGELLEAIAKHFKITLPIIFWFGVEEEDVAEDKREIFKFLKPSIDSLMNSVI
jgi:transcriptional regulator with XRE-family HTH domain